MGLNFDPNDPAVAQRLTTGLPPVLPSLAKPDKSASAPVTPISNPAAGLPPVTTLTPSPEEQRVSQVRAKLDKLQQTPSFTASLWDRTKGADTTLGKIGHVGAGILRGVDIAGEIAAPNLARAIPGTGLNRSQNITATQNELGQAQKESALGAETRLKGVQVPETQANTAYKQKETELLGQPKVEPPKYVVTPFQSDTGEPGVLEAEGPEAGTVKPVPGMNVKPPTAPKTTAEQHEEDMERIASQGRFSTDPKLMNKSIDAAVKAGRITQKQADDYRAFQATSGKTAGEKFQVTVEGQQNASNLAIGRMLVGKDVVAVTPQGPRLMPAEVAQRNNFEIQEVYPASKGQEYRDKYASVTSGFKALNSYRNDFKEAAPTLTPKERDAMRVLTTHIEGGGLANALAGLFDEIPIAGPLNEYANKLLRGTITSDQWTNMGPKAQKLTSDYFMNAIESLANMKATLGTVGRNPQQIQLEINSIPLPYLDWKSADTAFKNRRDFIQGHAASLVQPYEEGQQ